VINIEQPSFHFEALSYVWGTEKSPNPLYCGDGQLEITTNLDHALRHLRLPTMRRKLWVDAVCINQKSLEERARQVGYMRLVYKHSTRVIVWFGVKNEEISRAFTFAQELGELLLRLTDEYQQHEQHAGFNNFMMDILSNAFRSRTEDASALESLFQSTYFERVWCIQEVAASNQALAKSEDLELDFDVLLNLVPFILEWKGLDFKQNTLQMWRLIQQRRNESDENDKRPVDSMGPLLLLMMIIRNFKSTDPRDRIFALLGLSNEGLEPILGLSEVLGGNGNYYTSLVRRGFGWLAERINSVGPGIDVVRHPALRPNYEKSVRDVYRDFARYCVRRSPRVLDVLSHVQHYEDPGNDEYPSWVPKFFEQRLVSFIPDGLYLAGIPPTGHYRYFAEVHDNPLRPDSWLSGRVKEPDILQVDGFRVDEVEAVSEVIAANGFGTFSPEEIWIQLFREPMFPRRETCYPFSKEPTDIAFFMALVAGGVGYVVQFKDSLLQSLSSSRREAALQFSKQAKADVWAWLAEYPEADIAAYTDLLRDSEGSNQDGNRRGFESLSIQYCYNRRVFRTRSGILGIGPKVMKPGDFVVVLFGGKLPFILRQQGNYWNFLGESYIQHCRVMHGDEVSEVRSSRGRNRVETFRLK
jgi:hypothetical protein